MNRHLASEYNITVYVDSRFEVSSVSGKKRVASRKISGFLEHTGIEIKKKQASIVQNFQRHARTGIRWIAGMKYGLPAPCTFYLHLLRNTAIFNGACCEDFGYQTSIVCSVQFLVIIIMNVCSLPEILIA